MTLKRAWSGGRHAFRSHSLKSEKYLGYLAEFLHLRIYRFQHPAQVDKWLVSLA